MLSIHSLYCVLAPDARYYWLQSAQHCPRYSRTRSLTDGLFVSPCLAYATLATLAETWPDLACGYDSLARNQFIWGLCTAEGGFYLANLWYAYNIQAVAVHPPLRTRDKRLRLCDKVRAEVEDFEAFLLGWFLGAKHEDIGVGKVKEWIDWALWEGRAAAVKEEGVNAEIHGYVQKIEKLVGKAFRDGPGKAKALLLTLDPIAVEPRSLAWYALILIADTVTIISLMSRGSAYYRKPLPSLAAVFPPRPAALYTGNVSWTPSMSYFLRKHTSKTRLPVIYIHGIGVGLLPHIGFLEELHSSLNSGASADEQVGILAIETLQISSRLTTAILRSAEFVSQLTSLVARHFGSSRVVLVAHSYGTVLSTPIFKDPQICSRMSGTLFIIPVSIQLHMPDVAYNFTRRKPVRPNEWALWWFGKDPQVAYTLGRHLFWSECVLWRDQIEHLIERHGMRFTVSLASEDLIVNTRSVKDYVVKGELCSSVTVESSAGEDRTNNDKTVCHDYTPERWRGAGLEVLWWDGYDHAEVLETRKDRAKLAKVVVEYCSGK